jgi:gamma-glutamyl hercynylcysteine S-oxide synthase
MLNALSAPSLAPARHALRAELAHLLTETRRRTLALAQAWKEADADMLPPSYAPELNPPLWELGHVAWFQERWTLRNPEWHVGHKANPERPFLPSVLPLADAHYDSSQVAHRDRWTLPLPGFCDTLDYLAQTLQASLAALSRCGDSDDELYFWRLSLMHEAMHNEAWLFMAQMLGLPVQQEVAQPGGSNVKSSADFLRDGEQLLVSAGLCQLGTAPARADGFYFDNELGQAEQPVEAFSVDARAVTWRRYLPFVEATGHPLPVHVRHAGQGWEQRVFGQWCALDLNECATHLSWHDAQAWCDWAGRQLPTEAQWVRAQTTLHDMRWGEVWEWTASWFEPFAGFESHPYRDYSSPWFGSHVVLRGASKATSPVMRDARYRNYYLPQRHDVYCGFRSVAPAQNTAKR